MIPERRAEVGELVPLRHQHAAVQLQDDCARRDEPILRCEEQTPAELEAVAGREDSVPRLARQLGIAQALARRQVGKVGDDEVEIGRSRIE